MTPACRSRLRTLHRWIGFPVALLLFVTFFSGALAVFGQELQEWMQPEILRAGPLSARGIAEADRRLNDAPFQKNSQKNFQKRTDFLQLPSERDHSMKIWGYDGHVFQGAILDPATGKPLVSPSTEAAGAGFFVTLHDSFHLPSPYGWCLSALSGFGLLVSLGTGLWMHWRRLVPDFLLFRPQASAHRSWLDLHLLTGTLGVSIFTIIALTGVSLAVLRLVPTPQSPLVTLTPSAGKPQSLSSLLARGETLWGKGGNGFVLSTPGGLVLYRADSARFCVAREHLGSFLTKNVTGAREARLSTPLCGGVGPFLRGLHDQRWSELLLRWVYFLTAFVGIALLSSALALFLKTEARQIEVSQARRQWFHLWFRLARASCAGMTLGLPLATLALLWATRLPAPYAPLHWQENLFFALWVGSFLLVFFFPSARIVLIGALGLLGVGLPMLDLATRSWALPPRLFLTVDALGALIGIGAFLVLIGLPFRKKPRPARRSSGEIS